MRAVRTSGVPLRAEHEVIDDELASIFEKVSQLLLSFRPLEDVFLLHFDPRELAALPAQIVAQTREFLFFRQKRLAITHPLLARDDRMFRDFTCHLSPPGA